MRYRTMALTAMLILALAAPVTALAQERGRGKDRAQKSRQDPGPVYYYLGGAEGSDRGVPAFCRTGEGHPVFGPEWCRARGLSRDERGGKGPAFCRTGEGHPRFGREWCYEKGFGLGYGVGPILFERDPAPSGRDRPVFDLPGLEEILGGPGLPRLAEELGARNRGALTGRWLEAYDGGRVLQLEGAGRLVQLVDRNRDGLVDIVLIGDGER